MASDPVLSVAEQLCVDMNVDAHPPVIADDLQSVVDAAQAVFTKLSGLIAGTADESAELVMVDVGVDVEHLLWHWRSIIDLLHLPGDLD